MKSNKSLQLIDILSKDTLEKVIFKLTGSASDSYFIRPTYSGFVSYQVSDPDSTLSGDLTINLEMSNDGDNWIQATDASGEAITGSLSAGGTFLEKLSDVNPAIKFRLVFASPVTGTLIISTRV